VNARRDRLWLALRFRDLPLSALDAAESPEEPLVVAEKRKVVFSNPRARAGGVVDGMDLTTAQLVSGCRALARNAAREEEALHRLRDALYRFTPHIDIYRSRRAPHAGLLLEISTCLRLFSGVKNLGDTLLAFLEPRGHDLRWGLAHSSTGAWLLSFARHEITGEETRRLFTDRLDRLPVQVLYDYPGAVEALVKMGFATLGDVARQIRSRSMDSLTRRLGKEFTGMIADIYDIESDFTQPSLFARPVTTYVPDQPFCESIEFDYPVSEVEHLRPAIESLLQSLAEFLQRRQLACQHIQWRLAGIHDRREALDIHSDTPQSDWRLLFDLTLIQFDHTPLSFEVDCLTLACGDRMPRRDSSLDLDFEGKRRRGGCPRELAVTLARLKARVGDAAIYKISYRDSPLPELSHTILALAEKCAQQLPHSHRHGLRPAWLFAEPQPIEKRGRRLYWQGYLTPAVGPERVAGHWWRESVARDYYLARRQDNVAVWIYRDLYSRAWYVHGVFS
jgi:protein ImuB